MYWFWFQFQPERNLKSNFYSIPKKIRLVCQRTKIFVFGIWNSTEFVRLNIFLSNEEDFLFYIFFYSSKFRHQIVFFFFLRFRGKRMDWGDRIETKGSCWVSQKFRSESVFVSSLGHGEEEKKTSKTLFCRKKWKS